MLLLSLHIYIYDRNFQKSPFFLRGIDIVFGNLEGPIVKNPLELSDNSLKFAFNLDVMKVISWCNFNLFSLANNHTLDMGKEGLEETKRWLRKYQINFAGNPLSSNLNSRDFSFSTDKIIFLAFNQIFPFMIREEEIIKTVKSLNPDKFLIVSLHWGEEYKLTNSSVQQKLAHQIIEAGADLIIGHHPHVVQNIEKYQGKLIFYSLGILSLINTSLQILSGVPLLDTFGTFRISNETEKIYHKLEELISIC